MSRSARRFLPLSASFLLAAGLIGALAQTAPPAAPAGGNPLELKYGPPDAARGQTLTARCAGCHGEGLVSTNAKTPALAGQQASYARLQLAAFRAKLRPSEAMQRVAANLADQDIADIAAYVASLQPGAAWKSEDGALRGKGQALFLAGDPARNLMACVVCHGADGRGDDRLGVASVTNLAPEYAVAVLNEFKGAPAFPVPHPDAMRVVLAPHTPEDLAALAAYISSMQP